MLLQFLFFIFLPHNSATHHFFLGFQFENYYYYYYVFCLFYYSGGSDGDSGGELFVYTYFHA